MTTVYLDEIPVWNMNVPRIEVEDEYIAHVHCIGARFHVISYYGRWDGTSYIRYSEPKLSKISRLMKRNQVLLRRNDY